MTNEDYKIWPANNNEILVPTKLTKNNVFQKACEKENIIMMICQMRQVNLNEKLPKNAKIKEILRYLKLGVDYHLDN